MCKLLIIPKVTKRTQTSARKFAEAITPYLSQYDQDGVGYMALGEHGLFGERWLNPEDAFEARGASKLDSAILGRYGAVLEASPTYNSFGEVSDTFTCFALHTRMATSEYGLHNTHPFVSDDTALIHNGVIQNPAKHKMQMSTCDSEVILTDYTSHNVANRIDNIELVSQGLEGYFACAVISKDTENRWILDVFKDDRANLSAVYVPKLKTVVFVTDPQHVIDACADLNWTVGSVFKFTDNTLVRHDAVSGKVIEYVSFTRPELIKTGYKERISSIDISAIREALDAQNSDDAPDDGYAEYLRAMASG